MYPSKRGLSGISAQNSTSPAMSVREDRGILRVTGWRFASEGLAQILKPKVLVWSQWRQDHLNSCPRKALRGQAKGQQNWIMGQLKEEPAGPRQREEIGHGAWSAWQAADQDAGFPTFPTSQGTEARRQGWRKILGAGVRGRHEARKPSGGTEHDSGPGARPRAWWTSWDSWNSCQPQISFICKEGLRSWANIQEKPKGRQKLFFQVKVVEVTTTYSIDNEQEPTV